MTDFSKNVPTAAQLEAQYFHCHWLTNFAFQPIHIIRIDGRTRNLFILAGKEESIEIEIDLNGELIP